jgi:hypothetical protein
VLHRADDQNASHEGDPTRESPTLRPREKGARYGGASSTEMPALSSGGYTAV